MTPSHSPTVTAPFCIVVAWTVDDVEVVRERRTDLGERPITREIKVPRAVIWLNEGDAADLEKARAYATAPGRDYSVFVFPVDHADPLGAAKLAVMPAAPAPQPEPATPQRRTRRRTNSA